MIWDYIRDFLVKYVFGGYLSDGSSVEGAYFGINNDGDIIGSANILVKLPFVDSVGGYDFITLSIGDWLSTTATIIIMCIAVFLMILLVRWVWRLVTSAFLLK